MTLRWFDDYEKEDKLITAKEEKEETFIESSSKESTFKCGKPEFTEEILFCT